MVARQPLLSAVLGSSQWLSFRFGEANLQEGEILQLEIQRALNCSFCNNGTTIVPVVTL